MEGNATYVRDSGELASDVPTETMFELYDPQRNFSKANFSYIWDLGNGYGAVMFEISSGLQCTPCFFFFVFDAGKWSKGPSRLSATITRNRGTTHCGWNLEPIWQMLLKSVWSTLEMSKCLVCTFIYIKFVSGTQWNVWSCIFLNVGRKIKFYQLLFSQS